MAILEKIDKALEFLKNPENSTRIQELQNYAGALGQCMGILGGHPSMISQYTSLLQQTIPILLSLCTHSNAEIRLVAEEALNRIVVGGAPFHSFKVHLHFYKSITSDKHPRWLKAALSRVYLGKTWLRVGVGRGRIFAQSTLIRLKDIVDRIRDPQLIADKGDTLLMDCLDSNLPRILKALSPFATRDEIFGLLSNLIKLIDSSCPPIRRSAANCIADICKYHKESFIPHIVNLALGALQEKNVTEYAVLGWFGTLRTVFGVNPMNSLCPNIIPLGKYMMVYYVCINQIEITKSNHNILNAVMECLNVILADVNNITKGALLNPKGPVSLPSPKNRKYNKGHQRSLSSISVAPSLLSTASSTINLSEDILNSESSDVFHGQLHGSVSQSHTPHRSMEDLSFRGINTPDSPCESMFSELNNEIMTSEQFSTYVKEKLCENNEEIEELQSNQFTLEDDSNKDERVKINIGSFSDGDIPLKYCGRLIASRFLLSGYSNQTVPDQISRVSVKATALSCMIQVIEIYPEIMTLYLSIQEEKNQQNTSGNSELSTNSNNEQLNDFVLERNICYQESLTDSFAHELINKNTDLISQNESVKSDENQQNLKSFMQKVDELKNPIEESLENNSSTGFPNSLLDSKLENNANANQNQMAASCVSGDSVNIAMTGSNFTMGSQTTASNYPASTDLLTASIDRLTSSLDLEMIFDHFGESSVSNDNSMKPTEIEQKNTGKVSSENLFQEGISASNDVKSDKQISNEYKKHVKKCADVLSSNNEESHCDLKNHKNTHSEEILNQSGVESVDQHISDLFFLLEKHPDTQIKGLVRVCIGSFISSVCDNTSGEFNKWKPWCHIPKYIVSNMTIENLLSIVITGLTDSLPQCVNHSITALKRCLIPFSNSYPKFILTVLNNLRHIENNSYWLCKVNLCNFYSSINYFKLNILIPEWSSRSSQILNLLISFLKDQDQRVRRAAVGAIAKLAMFLQLPLNSDVESKITLMTYYQSEKLLFDDVKFKTKLLSDYKYTVIFSTLPDCLKDFNSEIDNDFERKNNFIYYNLKNVITAISYNLMISQCKYFTQGCLEALLNLSYHYPPAKYRDAYGSLGLLEICLQLLEYRTLTVSCCETLLGLITQIYAVEAWCAVCHKNNNKRLSIVSLNVNMSKENQKSWNQFESSTFSYKAEKLFKITLKLLNILIHIILDATPTYFQQKSGLMPSSPMKKKTENPSEDKWKKKNYNTISGHYTPVGYFMNDIVLLKLYASLKSAYTSHKVNTDPTTSIFLNFLSTTLKSLAVQLEITTEKEVGKLAEEILYYMKCLLPLKPDGAISCVTQLLKCLFSVNMTAQKNNLQVFFTETSVHKKNGNINAQKYSFYNDILTKNKDNLCFQPAMNSNEKNIDQLRNSLDSGNTKIAEEFGKSCLQLERNCYLHVKNFIKSKTDKEWTIYKQEYAKYIKLIEPIVVQALKGYTIQDNMSMQCKVLELMNQLLALRINYCFLNSDRVFIEFVLKQLEYIEHNEVFDCEELVRSIFTFLIHLSSGEHHTKQLMDIPKLIQLCDGLMASEVYNECIQSLHPIVYKVFVSHQQIPALSRMQLQEAQVTKEVLFSMLQKMMRDTRIVKLTSSVLLFSEEHPESHYKWSQLITDTVFHLLKQRIININNPECYINLDKLFDCIHKEVLFDQPKIEMVLKIMFDSPPHQENSSLEVKERWLATMLLFLNKIIYNMPENEILLTINYLKTSFISPASIFFNSYNNIDPLNVQTVNENCANLSPDVIFVRFLFRLLTYSLMELENVDKSELIEIENDSLNDVRNLSYWCKLTTSTVLSIKDILYLKENCRFPLLAKTAQTVLQNEQSGLNTGLYSPDENIPLKKLATICNRISWREPMLAVYWCHLLIRLKFLEQRNWGSFLGFLHNSSISIDPNEKNLKNDVLQVGCFLTLCEYFVDNGLDEVINLTWLLVNRIHYVVKYYNEHIVRKLVSLIHSHPSASGLLLQAISARCQPHMKGTYGINVFKILSNCHFSQSGALLFCICRFVGRLPISNVYYFVKLAIKQCHYLASLSTEETNSQIPLDDLQLAMEMLHNDCMEKRYPQLITEINNLASSVYNLSPLDIPLDRPINPHNIKNTVLDMEWFSNQMKSRCYKNSNNPVMYGKHRSLAKCLTQFGADELHSIFNLNEFDDDVVQKTLKLGTEVYIKELINKITEQECVKSERRKILIDQLLIENESFLIKDNFMESNMFSISGIQKLKKMKAQSHFFVPIEPSAECNMSPKKLEMLRGNEKSDIILPEFKPLLSVSLKHFQKMLVSIISLFPKHIRPLSQFDAGSLKDYQNMDKYTKRCCLVFRDKYFHKQLLCVQGLVAEFINAINNINHISEKLDSDNIDKIMDLFLPKSLSYNLMLFSIISLQYTSYLISQQDILCLHAMQDNIFKNEITYIDYTIDVCIKNASRCYSLKSVWLELNVDENLLRIYSAVNCLYNYMTYISKNIFPLKFNDFLSDNETNEELKEIATTCNKLLTMLQYWQNIVYDNREKDNKISFVMGKHIENLLVSLCRCKFAWYFCLMPPCACEGLQLFEDVGSDTSNPVKNERRLKSDFNIPIDILQDMDLLEQFLFRVNLIGWTSKKGFEEIWVSFLGALQGNGTHWAIRGMMQLILLANENNCCRGDTVSNSRIMKLKEISLDCNFYDTLFYNRNLETVPYQSCNAYHYSQVSIDYLRYASGLNEYPDIKLQNTLSRARKKLQLSGIDINSCIQLLMDYTSQVLTQSEWGLGARNALLSCIVNISDAFTSKMQWQWLSSQLSTISTSDILAHQYLTIGETKVHCVLGTDTPDVNQLVACFSSSFAPIRIAALHSAIMHLSLVNDGSLISADPSLKLTQEQFNSVLEVNLLSTIQPHLVANAVVSYYEQSLCWTALFSLIQCGNVEGLKIATEFLFTYPKHFCSDIILYGICQISLVKEKPFENEIRSMIYKTLDSNPEICHKILPLLISHIYSGSDFQLTESTLEPEQLLTHLQTFATLQKAAILSPVNCSKDICVALVFYLKDFLPPAAILNKVVQEFIDCCKCVDNYYDQNIVQCNINLHFSPFYAEFFGEIVFEVFEAAIQQDQLAIFNGWLFDGIAQFIDGKLSASLIPFCLLTLITSASPNKTLRLLAPLNNYILKTGCTANNIEINVPCVSKNEGTLSAIPKRLYNKSDVSKMKLNDMKLLCLVALHSNFTKFQVEKLKTICVGKASLNDLRLSLE